MGIPQESFTNLRRAAEFASDTIAKTLAIGAWIMDQTDGSERTLTRYLRVIEWLSGAARDADSPSVMAVCEIMHAHLVDLVALKRPLRGHERQLLAQWPGLVARFVATPEE